MYNGRINWNIPKHLARFEFSHPATPAGSSPPESLTMKVFPAGSTAGDGKGPFFHATLRPWRWVPSVPVSTKWMPLSTFMVQPPVPEAPGFKEAVRSEAAEGGKIDEYDIDPEKETSLLAGTDGWAGMSINSYSPRARGCWVTIHDLTKEEHGENFGQKYWPQDLKPWSVGAWMVCSFDARV